MVRSAFRTQGIAKVERVTTIDETLQACNAADVAGKPLEPATAKRLEAANLENREVAERRQVPGRLEVGEQIAQSGRGQT